VLYTTDQASEELGIRPRRVRQIAEELGIAKVGRDWVFTDTDLRKMRQRQTRTGPRQRDTQRGPKPKERGEE
jgi:hypothetical protein